MTSRIILSFLQITATLAAPSQILHSLQDMQQQMLQPLQDTNQQKMLFQQLHNMMTQQMLPLGGMQQQIPLLQPLQGTPQQQRLALEEQMFALQQFQALQRMNLVPSIAVNSPPILVLFPNNEQDVRRTDFNVNSLKYKKPEEFGDNDSEIIDAEPTEAINNINPIRAVLLMPNTRSFIGDFISTIPFLPIEINVPDTISWIYNGIAGIIAGIGQSLSQSSNSEINNETQNAVNNSVKSIWNRLRKKQQMPIVMIPLGQTF